MKTKEFIKRVKELGYCIGDSEDSLDYFDIFTPASKTLAASVSKRYRFRQSTVQYVLNINKELFDLIIEYSKTPIEDREENKEVISNRVNTNGSILSIGKCPKCDSRVHINLNIKYCGNCGRDLKWNDEKCE